MSRSIPCPRRRLGRLPLALAAIVAASPASGAFAAQNKPASVPTGFTIHKVADAPKGVTNCDDLARLDGHLFMGCQNNAQSTGGGGSSTVVEYADDGAVVNTWPLTDKVDGLGGDPLHHRVIATLNEDGNSHLATITPSAAAGQQVVNYRYSVNPASPTTTGPLHTGGGTDSVTVDSSGHVYIVASYGIAKTGTAVFRATLTDPASPTGTGTVSLAPTFLENATATNGVAPGGPTKLGLNDVDSSAIVPYTSSRFGGQFAVDDQTSMELIFASNINAGTGLTAIKTPYGLDDIRWATTDGGTLYVVDKGPASSGASALYRVSGPFVAGTMFGSNDSIPNQVVTVNLANGHLTPFVQGLQTAKGLVYLDAAGAEPALALGASASSTVPTATSGAPARSPGGTATPAKATSDSGDTAAMVLAIVALVAALGVGVLVITRRSPLAS